MTYISAFECEDGIVMCADTQETYEARTGYKDEKEYVEKLFVPENSSYPIAVGGAGLDEPIEAFALELFEQVEKQQPATIPDLRCVIKAAIEEVHASDAKLSAWPGMYRTTKCLVAAKPKQDEFAIFTTTGKRVSFRKKEPVIIGYDTPANKALLKRMYRPNLPMQQAVMLAIYLVSQSKARDVGVGGEPRIVVVRTNGAWIDDPLYIAAAEKRVDDFLRLTDSLFLLSVDIGIAPSKFPDELAKVSSKITELRNAYLIHSVMRELLLVQNDPNYKGEPYRKTFDGCLVSIKDGTIEIKEPSKDELEQKMQYLRDAHSNPNNVHGAREQIKLLEGKQVLYVGEEIVRIQAMSGSTG
ncbi:MAG: hypothetical protein ABSA78_09145 [Candidatus Sulfotelmatobacter sp.]|jgi:hypothetical protein